MNKIKLTKAQAWEKIALAFYKKKKKRTILEELEEDMASTGICHAIFCLWSEGLTNIETHSHLGSIINSDLENLILSGDAYEDEYFCPCGSRKSDLLRADYCWLQKCIEESNLTDDPEPPSEGGKK